MYIKGKIVLVYDIEVFPNCFSCCVKNTETKEILLFECSNRKDNLQDLIELFDNNNYLFCGYNNIHYDNPIINLLRKFRNKIKDLNYIKICDNIFKLSDCIVNSEDTSKWKDLKYATDYATLDLLTMLFSQKLRVGLKEMQVTMKFKNVQEYEGKFNENILDEDIPKMLEYNINDVESTEELLYRCEKDIELRLGIEKEFGIDVLSKDGMSIGTEILKTKYLEKTKQSWYDIKDLRSPCDTIDLKDVIFPFIEYKTPILQELLTEMKNQKVSAGRKGFEKHFLLNGVEITVGVGGIHSKNEPEIIIPKENELLLDSDVNSLYPSLIISYNLVPKHLGKEFLSIYGQVREDRLYAKRHHQDIKNTTYKLALNGATGNYQNQYSWLYDPVAVLKIRINGQLLLLKLAEMLIEVGANLKQLNTDGILYLIDKNTDYQKVLTEWEKLTKLTLETEEFESFYQYAINDYLGVLKGYNKTKDKSLLKKKGLFIDKVSLGKGMQPMIIPKAINAYFSDNIPIEDTIKNSKDLNDFVTYQKVDKKFSVEYNNNIIQQINRYYCATNGYNLFKCIIDKEGKRYNYTNLLKSSGVIICNNFDEFKTFPNDINYKYYIIEANKIIHKLKCIQTSLFDDTMF